nr:MAG: hypothetical protein [Metapenaeopsis lamellata majanivirus]
MIKTKTHPDYKSIVEPSVNADIIYSTIPRALDNQDKLIKVFLPSNNIFTEKDLTNFKIDFKYVDRLYYLFSKTFEDKIWIEMIFRMEFKNIKIYIMLLYFDSVNLNQPKGYIYVAHDFNLFINTFLYDGKHDIKKICKSLQEDGLKVCEYNYSCSSRYYWL